LVIAWESLLPPGFLKAMAEWLSGLLPKLKLKSNMEVVAQSKYVRISPRKLRLVADAVRGLSLSEIVSVLEDLDQRAAKPILLAFKQAIGNAVADFNLNQESLKLKQFQIGKGPTLKRWRAVGRGRSYRINKRTSHIRIVLEGKEPIKSKPLSSSTGKTTNRLKPVKIKKSQPKGDKKD
jgi:large subunit ribosomal protein L22